MDELNQRLEADLLAHGGIEVVVTHLHTAEALVAWLNERGLELHQTWPGNADHLPGYIVRPKEVIRD